MRLADALVLSVIVIAAFLPSTPPTSVKMSHKILLDLTKVGYTRNSAVAERPRDDACH